LFAAMNYRLKGLDPLLHSVRCLVDRPEFRDHRPPFRLIVAGNPESGAYQKQARRLGIRHQVAFVGHCPDMRNAYFAADFLIHPTFYDPCSLVVLEALACGLPVITTRANGASELLGPVREGYVIDDPHDHDSMAWAMMQMLDPATRLASAEASLRTAGQWTFDHHYEQMLDVFREVRRRKLSRAA
jgi:UDP-glucose:(heptosyl)LPS alpha-1,3-glucosyltransferase